MTNNDTIGHSFDVDALGVHVSVPPGTTAVAKVRPDSAGRLEFHCGVPGHRQTGMVGTLDAQQVGPPRAQLSPQSLVLAADRRVVRVELAGALVRTLASIARPAAETRRS